MSGYDLTPQPTQYEVSCIPEGNPERRHFTIALQRRPGDRWVVYRYPWDRMAYDRDGNESWREDDDGWRERHWLTWDEAVALAQRLAPGLTVNGFTVEDGLRMGQRQLERERNGV